MGGGDHDELFVPLLHPSSSTRPTIVLPGVERPAIREVGASKPEGGGNASLVILRSLPGGPGEYGFPSPGRSGGAFPRLVFKPLMVMRFGELECSASRSLGIL